MLITSIIVALIVTTTLFGVGAVSGQDTQQQLRGGSTNDDVQHIQSNRRRLFGRLWEIDFLGADVDFTVDSTNELVANYSIPKNRAYETSLLGGDCETAITGISISMVSSASEEIDNQFNLLSLAYDFNKTEITASNIWDDTTSTIEVCQVVQLVIPAYGWVISEDKRALSIDFDLSVDFGNNIGLGDATIIDSEEFNTNVTSYVEACKCDEQSFTCNTDPLLPGIELFICVKSISSDVVIDFLDSMFITQGGTSLAVVENNTISFPSLTAREYNVNENGVVVSTFIPSNLIIFADGETLSISGEIEMQLVGSTRRLHAVDGDINHDDDEINTQDIASNFELEISLQEKETYDEDSSNNSTNESISRGLTVLTICLTMLAVVLLFICLLFIRCRRRRKDPSSQ